MAENTDVSSNVSKDPVGPQLFNEGAIIMEYPISSLKVTHAAPTENVRVSILESIVLPFKFPALFSGRHRPWRTMLFYGLPGTGKSFLAKAAASEANVKMFSINIADIILKWCNESEKIIKNLFALAREHKPSIIFIDEIDLLNTSFDEIQAETIRRCITELCVHLTDYGDHKLESMVVIGATSRPWDVDRMIRRRLDKRIFIPLPELASRIKILKSELSSIPNNFNSQDFEKIGSLLEGYSCEDICSIVMKLKLRKKNLKKLTPELNYDPSNNTSQKPSFFFDKNSKEILYIDPENKCTILKMTKYDLLDTLKDHKPNVNETDLIKLLKFKEDFGDGY